MSDCACWRCRAGVGPCGGVGAFAPVQTIQSRSGVVAKPGRPHARSLDQLTTAVKNGPLAQRLEPAKSAIMSTGAARGVGGWSKNMVDMAKGKHGLTLQAIALSGFGYAIVSPVAALFVSDADARKRQGALYANWQAGNAQRVAVIAKIASVQHRLDYVDAYAAGLDRTITELDSTVASMGFSPPDPVVAAIEAVKQKRRELADMVASLQATEGSLNTAATDFADGGGSASDLSTANDLASGIDAQVASVLRAVGFAAQHARAATNSVNRWVDTINAQAQAAQQKQLRDTLVANAVNALDSVPRDLTA